MKSAIAAAMLAATALGATSLAPAAAATTSVDPARSGCVTYSEFKKVKNGMTKKQVAQTFGTNGKLEASSEGGGYKFEIRGYNGCTQYSYVTVSFTNGRVDGKYQAGL